MSGSWRINAFLGLIAFIFSYFLSSINNTWQTSLFRAVIGFILFFIAGYLVRLILHQPETESQQPKQNLPKYRSKEENQTNDTPEVTKDESTFQAVSLNALHDRKGEDQSR